MDQPFDRIAENYDFTNDLISLGFHRIWKRKLCSKFLTLHPKGSKQRILDVATGTGELAHRLKLARPDFTFVGVDPSARMLAVGQQRGRQLDQWILGASEALPFASESFDGLTCAYGVRNFSDREQAFREWHRVLKPGALAYVLEIHFPSLGLLQTAWKSLMPRMAAILSEKSAYDYLVKSTQAFPSPGALCQEIESAGFRKFPGGGHWLGGMVSFSIYERQKS